MFDTGGTQKIVGIWNKKHQAWLRDATGCVALYSEDKAINWFGDQEDFEIKPIFICSEEELVDQNLPKLKEEWTRRDFVRSVMYGTT